MTLKGHKNHYNVKLLRGYGISVSLKENKPPSKTQVTKVSYDDGRTWINLN